MDPLAILISLFGPFFVWPVEYLLPYPYIVEEIAKALIVWFSGKKISLQDGIKTFIICGVLFALTETVFYSININLSGQIGLFFIRFVTSSILHAGTFVIIFVASHKSKKLLPLGLLVAMLAHYLYNLYI